MGSIKIPYYVVRNNKGYWQPKPAMRRLGFVSVPCGEDGPEAWRKARELNEKWRCYSDESKKIKHCLPKRGSLNEAYERYKYTPEWKKKSKRTREDWERSYKHIGKIFGNAAPNTITLEHISLFREQIANGISQREAHRCIKIWRALWRVCSALGYCNANSDPSQGVRNTEPAPRQEVWKYSEIRKLVKNAWRNQYYGLAAIIAVTWDTSLSPVDVRKLTPAQRQIIDGKVVFLLDRAKTGRAAVGTISHKTTRIVDNYLEVLGVRIAPNAPMFRNRSGRPYSKDTLGDDFRHIRNLVFGPTESRQLQDFRRSGAIEAIRGGATTTQVGQKLANDIASNPSLGRTYTPVDLGAVYTADQARLRGRK